MNKVEKLKKLKKEYGAEYEKYKLQTMLNQDKKLEDVITRLGYVKADTPSKAFEIWDNSGDFYLNFEKWLLNYKGINVDEKPKNLLEILRKEKISIDMLEYNVTALYAVKNESVSYPFNKKNLRVDYMDDDKNDVYYRYTVYKDEDPIMVSASEEMLNEFLKKLMKKYGVEC